MGAFGIQRCVGRGWGARDHFPLLYNGYKVVVEETVGVVIMSRKETKRHTDDVVSLCKRIFGDDMVEKEWDIKKEAQDDVSSRFYCPRVDVVVAPINITLEIDWNIELINNLHCLYQDWVERLASKDKSPNFSENRNQNPRCWLAIEIEQSGSRKHHLGGMLNAAVLGKVGILLSWKRKRLKHLRRIRGYLYYLRRVEKISEPVDNLLILHGDDFLDSLKSL